MASSSYAIPNFSGGEISAFAQGRFDRPDYKVSMRVCLNSFPNEIGAWIRRPGTQYGSHTRGGAAGRVVEFAFSESAPITLEFTDGYVRFRNGSTLIPTNDGVAVVAVSTATPAVVQTSAATPWVTGNTLIFPGASTPLLENRQFTATMIDTTHFALADALTGTPIDGAALGALAARTIAFRVQEIVTPYTGGAWSDIRPVQAETTDILLAASIAPQALTVTLPIVTPTGGYPVFAMAPATFNDGPYLDPFTNGVQATPNATSGVISITLAFPAYSAAVAYAKGSFVTDSSVNYVSLADQNVGNTPSGGAPWWATTSASAAINGGQGFLGTDIGRLVRLFSEPPVWLIGSTYAAGAVVSYNPSAQPGESTYWQSLTSSNTGNAPGADLTNWQIIAQGAAIWSWGRIVSLTNIINPALSGSLNSGNMTFGGGLAGAFDGVFAQAASASATSATATGGIINPDAFVPSVTLSSFVGKNYSGASDQKIQQATIYPSSDQGFIGFTAQNVIGTLTIVTTLNLRGKATAPASSSDGTLLGTSGAIPDTFSAVNIVSSDQSTAWAYVWAEQVTVVTAPEGTAAVNYSLTNYIGQLSFFNPPGSAATDTGVNVEILGPALLYTAPVLTWRLGVYSNTTGYPTCGMYHDGRLWLAGAVDNRFDASVSNGIVGGTVNFAPTDQYGAVSEAAGISEVLNSDTVNPILWMKPDLQGIIMGTKAAEFLVFAPTSGPLADNNISAHQVTSIGSEAVEPRRTDHTLIFIKRFGRKLMEYFADVYSGKFTAPNLADRAQHIVRTGVEEIAYTDAVTPVIWGRNADLSWFGISYKRDTLLTSQGPTYAAWHRHALGSGRGVESLCAGPSVDGELDTVTLVTNDTTTNIRHVELLTDTMDELTPLADAWFLDDAVNPSSTSTTSVGSTGFPYGGLTINGLWHLNGKTVQVFAGGLDCGDYGTQTLTAYSSTTTYAAGAQVTYAGVNYVSLQAGNAGQSPLLGSPWWSLLFTDYVVANGSITVPYGDGVSWGPGRGLFTAAFAAALPLSQIVVGFTYNSDGQIVRPVAQADTGARAGPAFGKIERGHSYAIKLVTSCGLAYGRDFNHLAPVNTKFNGNGAPLAPLNTFTGTSVDSNNDDYQRDDSPCWRVSRPWPVNITAIGGFLGTQDQ
jgi:hypothetical protein